MLQPKISVVSPMYKTKQMIPELVFRIKASLESINANFEIILVDDGCPDNSWAQIEEECKKDERIKGIKLARNYGQQIAVSAGIKMAKGEFVIIMDGDLQNPPEAVPLIYSELLLGFDIVNTVSLVRNNLWDEITSRFFWFIINKILKLNMIPNQLMMKGMNRRFVDLYNNYGERVRVVSGITHDIGLKKTVIEVNNQKREHGKSGYNFWSRLSLMIDIILAVSTKPLEYLINFSLFSILLSFFVSVWNLASYFLYSDSPAGYMTLLSVICFFGSLTLLVLGIIGRYLSNIYCEVKERPLFSIEKNVNINK